jgi:hypothetical protein
MIPVQKKTDFEIDFLTEEARNTDGKLISKEDAIFIADWITRDYSSESGHPVRKGQDYF